MSIHYCNGYVSSCSQDPHFSGFFSGLSFGDDSVAQGREYLKIQKEMNYNVENEVWDWQGQDYGLGDNTSFEISKGLLEGENQNEGLLSCMFDNATTPVKACGDLGYRVTNNEAMGKELDEYREPTSQVKRRRMLQFESEVVGSPLFNDDMFLRSKETPDSLEGAFSAMSQWVAEFAEGTSASSNEYLDPSSEGWIVDCFNDADLHFSTEDIISTSGASDVQVDITELFNTPPESDTNAVENKHIHTQRNVVFKGRKSCMRTPPKLACSVAYPFTFIKPRGMHGDVTLKDINQWIQTPPKSKQNEQDPSDSYPTSAFSGKPVVGKTKIRTEGGEGSITIVRTQG